MGMHSHDGDKTKVLYVLGRGRSGTTVFANVLGEYPQLFCAGEVSYLWYPIVSEGGLCACGQPLSRCVVWSQVLDRLSDVSTDDAAAWRREVVTERNLIRLLRYRDGTDRWPALDRFRSLMGRVYRALSDVTGATVIVDSSKRPSYAAVVRSISDCDLYCVHMLRDPRASAYSWANRRHASVFKGQQEVKRRGALDSTVRWSILNIEAEILLRRLPPARLKRVRYEDFVAQPLSVTKDVVSFVGESVESTPFLDERRVQLRPTHTIAGNPSRFETGEIEIRESTQWLDQQKRSDKLIATALALPFLARYRYRIRSR